jgi:hypothetical protein
MRMCDTILSGQSEIGAEMDYVYVLLSSQFRLFTSQDASLGFATSAFYRSSFRTDLHLSPLKGTVSQDFPHSKHPSWAPD